MCDKPHLVWTASGAPSSHSAGINKVLVVEILNEIQDGSTVVTEGSSSRLCALEGFFFVSVAFFLPEWNVSE